METPEEFVEKIKLFVEKSNFITKDECLDAITIGTLENPKRLSNILFASILEITKVYTLIKKTNRTKLMQTLLPSITDFHLTIDLFKKGHNFIKMDEVKEWREDDIITDQMKIASASALTEALSYLILSVSSDILEDLEYFYLKKDEDIPSEIHKVLISIVKLLVIVSYFTGNIDKAINQFYVFLGNRKDFDKEMDSILEELSISKSKE